MDDSGYRQIHPRVVSRAAAAAVGCSQCGMFKPVLDERLNLNKFGKSRLSIIDVVFIEPRLQGGGYFFPGRAHEFRR